MINLKDPRQLDLFDRYSELLGPSAYRRLKEGWQGHFRDVIHAMCKFFYSRFEAGLSVPDSRSSRTEILLPSGNPVVMRRERRSTERTPCQVNPLR